MKNYLKTIATCALVAFFCSCEGEDGAIGPAGERGQNGIDGVDGTNGADGQNGTDGQNGVGFDELVKYGSIKINLSGTTPDNTAFTDESEFKFTPTEASDLFNFSSVSIVNDSITEYSLRRFLSAPDDIFQETTARIFLRVINPGETTQRFEFNLNINDYAIVTDNHKFFRFSNGFSDTNSNVTNFNITDYNFDSTTHNLTFSFSFDVAGAANDTGNDLTITGEVNTIVLEGINNNAE
ncbi:collagen-like protein [Aquimarina aquimarini]|uniref:collagen-like protein n=1 Tax=Aquimarina aquimarini TaxID=1191734 RepID=UPI001901CB17|nr:collagen-like protein [Aquimarina aquimarini]